MPDSSNVITEIKISELEPATQANAEDQLEANQAGTTRSITLDQVSTLVAASDYVQDAIDGAVDAATDVVSIKDFGATGDGVTDDTMAIQAAIDAVRDAGGGIVDFPSGTYKLMSSTLGEVFDNAGAVVSVYSLALRAGVSLRGQIDRSAILSTVDAPSGTAILPVDPVDCTIEGFELVGPHTMAVARATGGIVTVSEAGRPFGDPARVCRNNTFRNLYIHGFGSYGIGFQNASPVNCRVVDCDFSNIGSAAIDCKARLTPAVAPIGNSISNFTSRDHGNRLDDGAIDIRGVWQLSNITISDFGNNVGQPGYGIRFRQCPTPVQVDAGHMDWAKAAQYSTLTNFYIKADPAANAVYGIMVGSDDVHISNGSVEGCADNYIVFTGYIDITAASWAAAVATITVANDLRVGDHFAVRGMIPTGYNGEDLVAVAGTTAAVIKYAVAVDPGVATTLGRYLLQNWIPRGVTLANITSRNASVYGLHLERDAEDTSIVGYISYNSTTAGLRNEGIYTKIVGFGSNGDTTPMTVLAEAAPTQMLFNGPDTGSISIGGAMSTAQRINIVAPIVGGANAYGVQVSSEIGAGVTNAYGYSTALAAPTGISTNFRHFYAAQGTVTGTLTNQYGFYAQSSLVGAGTVNAGFYSALPAAATNWNFRAEGAAQNYILGLTGFGTGKSVPAALVDISASTTARASLCLSHGVAPTGGALVDGAMWTTTGGLFIRINGVTKTVTLT